MRRASELEAKSFQKAVCQDESDQADEFESTEGLPGEEGSSGRSLAMIQEALALEAYVPAQLTSAGGAMEPRDVEVAASHSPCLDEDVRDMSARGMSNYRALVVVESGAIG